MGGGAEFADNMVKKSKKIAFFEKNLL